MTLGQIALKYMLNILTGPRKEAVECLSCSLKQNRQVVFFVKGAGHSFLFRFLCVTKMLSFSTALIVEVEMVFHLLFQ